MQYGVNDDTKVEGGFGEQGTDWDSERLLGIPPPLVFCCINRAKAAVKSDELVPLAEVPLRVEMEEL